MSEIRIDPGATASSLPDQDLRLRRSAQQLEGVFVEHLFKAMRDTVPEGGLVNGGSGEEIFTSLLDRHLADQLPAAWDRGLGGSIYRQLRAVITTDNAAADTPPQQAGGE